MTDPLKDAFGLVNGMITNAEANIRTVPCGPVLDLEPQVEIRLQADGLIDTITVDNCPRLLSARIESAVEAWLDNEGAAWLADRLNARRS